MPQPLTHDLSALWPRSTFESANLIPITLSQ